MQKYMDTTRKEGRKEGGRERGELESEQPSCGREGM